MGDRKNTAEDSVLYACVAQLPLGKIARNVRYPKKKRLKTIKATI